MQVHTSVRTCTDLHSKSSTDLLGGPCDPGENFFFDSFTFT